MLSKAKIKEIRLLDKKKIRDRQHRFVAEGNKLVADMLPHFNCDYLVTNPSWMATQGDIDAGEIILAQREEIKKISNLKTPQDVLAVLQKPQYSLTQADPASDLVLALDGIQDPGNLGTIVRIADWFGITHIVCSTDTADVFSHKAVQATMGALTRVKVHYTDLNVYLGLYRNSPVYGTFLDGENIYKKQLSANGIIVMGNEGNGIRPYIEAAVNERLYIPSYPVSRKTSESLNVAAATAVICAEFRRGEC